MPKWRIYYAGGETFSGKDSDVFFVPTRGVLAIVQDNPDVKAEIATGGDYYVWEGRWRGVDIFGLWDYLVEPGWKRVLFGRTVTQQEYNETMRKACIDKDNWLPRERRFDK